MHTGLKQQITLQRPSKRGEDLLRLSKTMQRYQLGASKLEPRSSSSALAAPPPSFCYGPWASSNC